CMAPKVSTPPLISLCIVQAAAREVKKKPVANKWVIALCFTLECVFVSLVQNLHDSVPALPSRRPVARRVLRAHPARSPERSRELRGGFFPRGCFCRRLRIERGFSPQPNLLCLAGAGPGASHACLDRT